MAGILRLLKQKWFLPIDPTMSFTGKNVIVTGANVGLGYEAAIKFVALGASKVILAVRSVRKGETAQLAIEKQTGKTGVIEVWKLDMLSYDSIRDFAKQAETLDHLDIAVLNAGAIATAFELSSYGFQTTLQVNTLSTTLLAFLLLPKLQASKTNDFTPVLEIVSSGLYRSVTIPPQFEKAPLEAYNKRETFSPQPQYMRSKYFVQCAVKGLAKFVTPIDGGEPSVIVTSTCPGACKSSLGRNYPTVLQLLLPVVYFLFMRTTEGGSRNLVSATQQGVKVHGQAWKDDDILEDIPSLNGKLQQTVWHEIVVAISKNAPDMWELVRSPTAT